MNLQTFLDEGFKKAAGKQAFFNKIKKTPALGDPTALIGTSNDSAAGSVNQQVKLSAMKAKFKSMAGPLGGVIGKKKKK